ncbi:MAG: P-II family nitrogen regulator [Myxococcota bacterium]
MKMIRAIVKPFQLEKVREALQAVGVEGLTVLEARGFGRQKGHTEVYRGAEYQVDLVPKIEVHVAVRDDQAAAVVEAIQRAAHTGKIGDGKIFVLAIEDAIRIRTGERGEAAL